MSDRELACALGLCLVIMFLVERVLNYLVVPREDNGKTRDSIPGGK